MKYVLPSRALWAKAAIAAPASIYAALAIQSGAAFAQSAPGSLIPSQLSAVYDIALNGYGVGTFRYTSETTKSSYKLASDVDLSLLMGAFKWKGVSHTAGQTGTQASAASLKPASFAFDYSSTLKSGSLNMGFSNGAVKTVAIDPPMPPIDDMVPVKPEHLTNVLDPLSAILAITQDKGGKPCDRKIAVFDGKQRFDLQLIYRRQEAIEGSTETASVCRVKYIPIAGYRQTEETANLARTTGIEIAFRQAAGAGLFVPQKITLPTLAGNVDITLQRVDASAPGSGQVALFAE